MFWIIIAFLCIGITAPYVYCRWTKTGRLPTFCLSRKDDKLCVTADGHWGDYLDIECIEINRYESLTSGLNPSMTIIFNHYWLVWHAWSILLFRFEQWIENGYVPIMNPDSSVKRITITLNPQRVKQTIYWN